MKENSGVRVSPKQSDTYDKMTYQYDDRGIKCLVSDGDCRPLEPNCLDCGYRPEECECDAFVPATYWDEKKERWVEVRLRCPPPRLAPCLDEPCHETTTFLWSTVEAFLEDMSPHHLQRFKRWRQPCRIPSENEEEDYKIELDYYRIPTKPNENPNYIWWAIRPCDNFPFVKVWYRSGSPLEMEFCECLPSEEYDDCFRP